jgi:hypothetical protein
MGSLYPSCLSLPMVLQAKQLMKGYNTMITREVTASDFAQWVKQSESYSNNFSYDGSIALFEYLDQLSDDMGENIDYDPIAWCVEYSEYEDLADAWNQQGNGTEFIEGEELAIDDNIRLWLENNTTVIELDNGGIVIADF